jgi:tetratricopeptide (TPR) repeat protein
LLAHLDAGADALDRMVLVAVTRPDAALADMPLHETLIRIDPYVNEWHKTFARAGSQLNELTSVYRALALATQASVGIGGSLRSYAVTERARRRLIPFPGLDRPRMTPAMTFLLVALHNLFWLARNRKSVARDEGDGQLQALAADTVLAPLDLLAQTDTLDIGDLIAMTALSGWAIDLFSRTSRRDGTPAAVEAGASEGAKTPPLTLATAAARSSRQENAEIWLAAALAAYRPEFAARGYELPRVTISVSSSWRFHVLRFGHALRRLRWHEGAAGLMVADIVIDTRLADPLEVLRALKHQLIHAALAASGSKQRHDAAFHKAARALGMEPRRSTRWTPAGRDGAKEIAAKLGPYPRPGPDRPDAVSDELVASLIALATFSPIARIEGAIDGLPSFAGWADAWPGLRHFILAPEATSFRQELVSRLAVRLTEADPADGRMAAFLDMLTTVGELPRLDQELWFEFVAGLLVARLHAEREEDDRDTTRWRGWAQAPHARSLAYLTGRIARVAEEVAARGAEHEYPKLVWRWRDIARLALVPWLDTRGHLGLCLGYWLEGLLGAGDIAPTLTIGRKVCGFGLAEIVGLWQRAGETAGDREPSDDDLAPEADADLQAALASCRTRLAAAPAMQKLIREARHFDVHRRTLAGRDATERAAIATFVRYRGADESAAERKQTAAAVAETRPPAARGQDRSVELAVAYRDRGIYSAAQGEYDRAIADYGSAIALDPEDAVAHHKRGLAYAAQGRHALAIEDYDEAIRLDPGDADTHVNRAVSCAKMGMRERAIEGFTEAIRINPNHGIAHCNRGLAYAAEGHRDRAIMDFSEAIRLNPKDAVAYHNRGRSYEAQGEHDRAIWDYNEATKLDPKYAAAHHQRGLAYAAKGEHERATWDYDEAIKLDPGYAVAYHNRAVSHAARSEHDRAIRDFDEAIRLDPTDALAHFNRGRSYEQLGDRESACADYQSALALETSEPARRLIREGLARLGVWPTSGQSGNATRASEPAPPRAPDVANRAGKIGRNQPCPCGSGKRYKNCHGRLN